MFACYYVLLNNLSLKLLVATEMESMLIFCMLAYMEKEFYFNSINCC